MSTGRRRGIIEGNNVRKMHPVQRPYVGRRPQGNKSRHAEKVSYVNILYTVFLAAAACMVLWSCVNYLQLQAETTSRMKHIASLETQLENLRKENDDHYTRIMTSVNLDYIRDVAVNELGMVYAGPDQVVLYDNGTDDYVRQNEEIPSDTSSLKDKILGKDGE